MNHRVAAIAYDGLCTFERPEGEGPVLFGVRPAKPVPGEADLIGAVFLLDGTFPEIGRAHV